MPTRRNLPAGESHPGLLRLGMSRAGVEVRSLLRDKEQVMWTLAFPVVLMVVFGSIFGGQELGPSGITFAQYFVAGMIASGAVYTTFQNLAIAIPQERDEGTLKRLEGTPMPKAAYFLGKFGSVVVAYLGQLVMLLLVATLFYDVSLPKTLAQWLALGWVSVLGLLSCTLLGLAFSSVPKSGKSASAIVSPIVLLLQFTSGVFVVFSDLPAWMQQFGALFPLKWMAQGMRFVFLPESIATIEVTGSFEIGRVALVLAGWTALGAVLALVFFRWRRRGDD
ncbi:MAG: ABC transporter permease [Candidatus Nanopelagicales bacterium]